MTDEQREVLAVELLDLRIQARQTIPQMAEVYAQCTRNLNDTRHYQDGAFDNTVNPNLFAPGGVALPSAVYPHWVRLRDELQSILAATAENLNLTALALEAIADGYAAQDASAARELERISGELPAEVPVHPPEHPGNPEHDDSLERAAMISDFEIMAKAREIRDLAVEVELRRRAKQYVVTGGQVPPELAGAIESGFDDVLTVFERFTGYDPSSLEAMSESMTQASTGLDEPVADTIGSVAIELAGWWGPDSNSAKQVFEREFLLKMPGILRNQQAVFGELVDALDVSVQIAASSREDLMAIADNTVTALHAAEREESADLGHALTVLGVVAGGLAAVFSGGSTLALALVGSAVDLTVAGMAKEAQVEGNRPRNIIDSMRAAVELLEDATEAKEAELGKALAADLATVAETRATHLEPIRPNIGDDLAADLDGFLPPSWK